jgi:hypothetical protein
MAAGNGMNMKVFVKHTATDLYLQQKPKWCAGLEEALEFDSVDAASEFCKNHDIENLEVVVIESLDKVKSAASSCAQ